MVSHSKPLIISAIFYEKQQFCTILLNGMYKFVLYTFALSCHRENTKIFKEI